MTHGTPRRHEAMPNGKLADVYLPATPATAVVLFWHGRGPNERDVLATLAAAVSDEGTMVIVPDWRSDAPDGGADDLRTSIAFARRTASQQPAVPLVLAGWSLGATAAAQVAFDPTWRGERPAAFVGIAGLFSEPGPFGIAPIEMVAGPHVSTPTWLVHGARDDRVPTAESQTFAEALRSAGVPVTFTETAADHAGVIMTKYDPVARRCVPASGPEVADRGTQTIAAFSEAARQASADRGPPV